MNMVASLKKTTKRNTGILTGVNVRWPLRVGLMMCPLYFFYSEDKSMGWLLLGLILFVTVPIVVVFGYIAADLLGIKKGDEL
nr:MAG TPA: hypothetical protein [Caudoviricetes sp.]